MTVATPAFVMLAAVVALAWLTGGSGAAAAATRDIDAVLSAHQRAVGGQPQKGTLELVYDTSTGDMTGTTRSIVDRATGAYVERYLLGLSHGAAGFDGRRAWMEDLSGAITPQDGGDRVALAINEAYRNANRWWRRDRGGARFHLLGRERIDDGDAEHLQVTPPRGKTFDAWFDVASGHLVRVAEQQQYLRVVTRYADYEAHDGLAIPRTIEVDAGSGPAAISTSRLRAAKLGPARGRDAYAMPPWVVRDAAIDGGAAQTTVPFRLVNNHIFVDARVNGQGPFAFFVDTGGHTILTPFALAGLGLASQGTAPAGGAGEQAATNGYVRVHEIAIGGVRFRDQTAFTLDLAPRETEGLDVGGMVGFELFRRFVVRIDYAAQTLTFIDPARFDPRGEGTPLPFRFYDHQPQVDGTFDGRPARFDIDTGSRSDVDLTSPFVTRARLREGHPDAVLALTGWGVGGPVKSYVVRDRGLTLGAVAVRDVVAGLSTSRGGSFSDSNFEGNVGNGVLKRFRVTFDYAHQRLYFEPRRPLPADIASFDRSGLWINAHERGFLIVDVAAGSPAHASGLAAGDVIVAIDGRQHSDIALWDARAALRVPPPGTRVRLDLVRDGARRSVELVLRDLLASASLDAHGDRDHAVRRLRRPVRAVADSSDLNDLGPRR